MTKFFFKTYLEVFKGIELCLENNLPFPSLSLIYSSIDSLAWIAYGDIGVKERFVKWVDEFMYTQKKLEPESIDLYSARCAMLHTLTPNSNLSKQNKAKIVAYTWGNADASMGNQVIDIMNDKTTVFVHVNDLFDALKLGVLNFINGDTFDDECLQRANQHFRNLSKDILNEYINMNEKK
ncbi:hypothetical protein [Sulfuricurvum sp. RIFOXYD12_FULL_44_77]|uniref:hypothetical protein n=1 Tax=Sulfuricurvum sp. RIFOXYD12_FULL_44_77 TaxID=1802248 RepID=UPI0008AB18E5|nr:hypothetical protein [Sulfuricurvum sp. RIFOXYD12_FULL_44_77]OHD90648.1 MAG: hypothetical protein A2517_04360 [Sulfuricurvum sp. RIFOXYD12_FULL_44_77]